MSEDENRAWMRGANSDTSMRVYRKTEGPMIGLAPPPGGSRGRGRGRGASFERHRSGGEIEAEELAGPPMGRGRGRGFERSISGGPAGEISTTVIIIISKRFR